MKILRIRLDVIELVGLSFVKRCGDERWFHVRVRRDCLQK